MAEEQNPFRERLGLLVPINNLQPGQQDKLLASAEVLSLRRKDYVFRQGERDSYAFYLLNGEIEMWSGDQLIKKVTGGDAASFQPLAQLQPRQMSAVALGNVQVLRVDRTLLDQLLSLDKDDAPPGAGSIEVEEYETADSIDWLASMLQSELFTRIPPSHVQRLIDILERVEVKAGDEIIRQGAAGDYYYVIQTGQCEVCRANRLGKEIRLAELGPGETFGEEALVSDAKRNATVRMLSDGVLGRLTQEHFIELIREPVLKRVSLDEAKRLVAAGAQWLDVRFPEEHKVNGLPGSLNVPLSFLRARLRDLVPGQRYVAYCDSGGRSSAAAFLLAQEGFDVCFVANGAIDEIGPAPDATPATATATRAPAAPPPRPAPAVAPPPADALVDAEVRAQALAAEVERARLQIEQAQRLMAEAAAAKREAEQIVQQRLQDERNRLEQEAAAVRHRMEEADRLRQQLAQQQQIAATAQAARAAAEQIMQKRLQEERARLEQETETVRVRLAEAERLREALEIQRHQAQASAEQLVQQKLVDERARIEEEAATVRGRLDEALRLKADLERQHEEARAEAERQRREQEEKARALEEEIARALAERERRLEAVYRDQTAQLERLQAEHAKAKQTLDDTWQQIEVESSMSKERLAAAMRLEEELKAREADSAAKLAAREQELREALKAELARERQRFEAEFARSAAEIARARQEKQAAEAAKLAAAEEAGRIIQEYQVTQQRELAELQQKLLAERRAIAEEAERLRHEMATALAARDAAESARRVIEEELRAAQQRQVSSAMTEAQLRAEISALETRAATASRDITDAIAAAAATADRQRRNEERLERTYSSESELGLKLRQELDEWVQEQERFQSSTAQREELARRIDTAARIRHRAAAAKKATEQSDFSLLDEIAAKFGEEL